jgi:hypothetical protein
MEVDILIANDSNATVNKNPVIPALAELPKAAHKAPTMKQPNLSDTVASRQLRETGDQVNGFMLCALVSQSAKRIKGRAERVGVSLPMSIITRSVLNAYLIAAKDHDGPFTNAQPDLVMIRSLNEQVLQEVLARQSRDRLSNNRAQPAQAGRFGDDSRR